MGLDQPFMPILETGILELIGKDEQIAQNEYSAGVSLDISPNQPVSGEILAVLIIARETGSGTQITQAGKLFILDVDPTVLAGAVSLGTASDGTEFQDVLGVVAIAASDWVSDASGAVAYKQVAIPFQAAGSLFFVYKHEGATTINSGAGDEEHVEMNAWYRRES